MAENEHPVHKRTKLMRFISENVGSGEERGQHKNSVKHRSLTPRVKRSWRKFSNSHSEDKNTLTLNGISSVNSDDTIESLDVTQDVGIHISYEATSQSFSEQLRTAKGNVELLQKIEDDVSITLEKLQPFMSGGDVERGICMLWSAFLDRDILWEDLIQQGVDINFKDTFGYNALHLASQGGAARCLNKILSRHPIAVHSVGPNGCTALYYAAVCGNVTVLRTLLNHRAVVSSPPEYESPLHCIVRCGAVEGICVLEKAGADVNMSEPHGETPLHVAADLGSGACVRELLSYGADHSLVTRERGMTALHLAAEDGCMECIGILLDAGADVNAKDRSNHTALHYSARSQCVESVDLLLTKGANANACDSDGRTPLHVAVGRACSAPEVAELLVERGAHVNARDNFGYTPLHLAALGEFGPCVDMLLDNGADITAKTNTGATALSVVLRWTPGALLHLTDRLNRAVSVYDSEMCGRDVELRLDFRAMIPPSQKSEIEFLKTLIDEGQDQILEHPLCEAFLHLKWQRVRKYFVLRLIQYALFVMMLTVFVLLFCFPPNLDCCQTTESDTIDNETVFNRNLSDLNLTLSEDNCTFTFTCWLNTFEYRYTVQCVISVILLVLTCLEMLRKAYHLAVFPRSNHLFTIVGSLMEWLLVVLVVLITLVFTSSSWMAVRQAIGAYAVLISWVVLMILVGQFPTFGAYIQMYTVVSKDFAKLLCAYACLLVGFSFCLCVLYGASEPFSNPFSAFLKVLVMMTGELELGDSLQESDGSWSVHIALFIFVLLVTIVLMNLLVGLAVNDIQGLQKTADLELLVHETEMIAYVEQLLFSRYMEWVPSYLRRPLQNNALVAPQAYRLVLVVRPHDPRDTRLPKPIVQAAYRIVRRRGELAVSRRNTFSTVSNITDVTDQISATMKSYKRRSRDHTGFLLRKNGDMRLIERMLDSHEESLELLREEVRRINSTVQRTENLLADVLTHFKKGNSV